MMKRGLTDKRDYAANEGGRQQSSVAVVEGDIVRNEDKRHAVCYHHEDFPEVPANEEKNINLERTSIVGEWAT